MFRHNFVEFFVFKLLYHVISVDLGDILCYLNKANSYSPISTNGITKEKNFKDGTNRLNVSTKIITFLIFFNATLARQVKQEQTVIGSYQVIVDIPFFLTDNCRRNDQLIGTWLSK